MRKSKGKNKAIAGRRNRLHAQQFPLVLKANNISEAEAAHIMRALERWHSTARMPILINNPDIEIVNLRPPKRPRLLS